MRTPGMGPLAALASGLGLLASAAPALAQWSTDPAVNTPVCTAAGDQAEPVVAPDNTGGAYVAWADRRSGTWDVYVLRLAADGTRPGGWPVNGLAVATTAGDQANIGMIADGAGGAVLVWQDRRSGTPDLYATRVRANGTFQPGWPANGLALCTATGVQGPPAIATDGAGGAIVAWSDERAGATNADIYATRVLGSGAIAGGWPAGGMALCTAPDVQQLPVIVSDGSGGAIVAWQDDRGGSVQGWDVYALRVTGAGARVNGWPANGLLVCGAAGNQFAPAIETDDNHGCFIAWEDFRVGSECDPYLQRITGAGAVAGGWPANGRALVSAPGDQLAIVLQHDSRGGVLAAWEDYRNGLDGDIYALRVSAGGNNRNGWPAAGLAVCNAAGAQQSPVIVSDGGRGAIFAWEDYRTDAAAPDIYAQHLNANGAINGFWPANGAAISTAAGSQLFPALLPATGGDAIVAWRDFRGGATSDIYAQRVQVDGLLAAAAVVVAAAPAAAQEAASSLVQLSWPASLYDVAPPGASLVARYDVMRLGEWVPAGASAAGASPAELPDESPGGGAPAPWVRIASVPATGAPLYGVTVDPGGPAGTTGPFTFRVDAVCALSDSIAWPSAEVTTGGAGGALRPAGAASAPLAGPSLAPVAPNPARDGATLRLALATATRARLAVYDAGGRLVCDLAAGELSAGTHALAWDGRDGAGRPAPSGVYLARLEAGGTVQVRRFVLRR